MRRSVIDGAAFAGMMGVGEYYLPAFVLALHFGDVRSGLISTIPPAVGALMQLASPLGIRWLGSNKRWVVACCVLQCLSFVPLTVFALLGSVTWWALFLTACVYFSSGMAAGAAWSTWIGAYVPDRIRARWFGLRLRILNACIVLGFLAGGAVLYIASGGMRPDKLAEAGEASRAVLSAFALLFVAAGVLRVLSTLMLALQHEPPTKLDTHRRVPLAEFLRRCWSRGSDESLGARLLVYMFAARFAENLAAPYVTPYLLDDRGFSYSVYAVLIALVLAGKAAAMGPIGVLANRIGPRTVLLVSGLCICPLGWLWLVSAHPVWVAGVQSFSGVAWAGYDLATWLLILRYIRDEERTSLMSLYFVGNWGAVALGAACGGFLLKLPEASAAGYELCFTVTSFARLLTIPLLLRAIGMAGLGSGWRPFGSRGAGAAASPVPPDPEAMGTGNRDE